MWVEGSRSQLWRISSGRGLRLVSGGRSAGGCLLLQAENGKKTLSRYRADWKHSRMLLDADLRMLFLESGTSHSGDANSFSPSELLLWPGSDTEPLDISLDSRVGRTSSSFPSAVTNILGVEAKGKGDNRSVGKYPKLTSLFLHGSRLGDVGERVESFGGEALALFVL